jgi:hypothetical protein
MKKILTLAFALLLTTSVMGAQQAFADKDDKDDAKPNKGEKITTDYMHVSGVISEIEQDKEVTRVTLEDKKEIVVILTMKKDTLVFNSGTTKAVKVADLKKGQQVEAFYDKNKPMILIYPTTVTPELVILKNADVYGEVKVSKFDKEFVSLDGKLKLNIGEETKIVTQDGKSISKKNLGNKELVVFYSATTRSIPAQTTPTKIMTLDFSKVDADKDDEDKEDADEDKKPVASDKIQAIIKKDHIMKNGVKMIPLRKVAVELGYKVKSQGSLKGALVTKNNVSFTINRGDKMYGFNKSLGKFEVAPFVKNGKTYVPESFVKELITNK